VEYLCFLWKVINKFQEKTNRLLILNLNNFKVALGQSLNLGVIGVWKICPLFKGVGYAATIQAFWLNCYYIVILAWALFYLWHSFSYTLPWSHCNNSWNTPSCISSHDFINKNLSLNATSSSANEFWE
jgi:solute carrier family 6 GABA transporter-like protein 1